MFVFGRGDQFWQVARLMSGQGKRILGDHGSIGDASSKKARVMWNSDGVNGGKSCIDILLNWLTYGSNYSRFKGGDGTCRMTKSALANELLQEMEKADDIFHRKVCKYSYIHVNHKN